MKKILAPMALLIAMLFSAVAFAQDAAAAETLPDWAQVLLTILNAAIPVIVGFLGYLAKKFNDSWRVKLETEAKKVESEAGEYAALAGVRALAKVVSLTRNAVVAAENTFKKEMLAAKSPDSPGGASITKEEGDNIKDKVFGSIVKSAGGWAALVSLVTAALGVDEASSETVSEFVDNLIETELHEVKKEGPTKAAA